MPDTALNAALDLFRAKLGIETPAALRTAFYDRDDLVRQACEFCEQQGVDSSGARVVSRLVGIGRNGFHHLEPNLRAVYQGDMPRLAHMIECEASTRHAVHADCLHDPQLDPLPAYLNHKRGHFSLEAVECRNGEWRYWHLTTLRQHFSDTLETLFYSLANKCVPTTRHRAVRPSNKVELQTVAKTASEDEIARELRLYAQRFVCATVDTLLADPKAIPGRVGMSPPRPDDYGTPDDPTGTSTLALMYPGDADLIVCKDVVTSAVSLGAFPLTEWIDGVVGEATRNAVDEFTAEAARLRNLMASLQGPPEPRRMIIPARYENLFGDEKPAAQ